MHQAVGLAGIGQSGILVDRQCIDVGAQAEATAALPALQRADHAGAAQAGGDLIAPLLQPLGDAGTGAVFRDGQLRVPGQGVADRDGRVGACCDFGQHTARRGCPPDLVRHCRGFSTHRPTPPSAPVRRRSHGGWPCMAGPDVHAGSAPAARAGDSRAPAGSAAPGSRNRPGLRVVQRNRE
ncbi:hypothetical protein G6F50_015896 [Rhizopus delemar]|uniref:Uncharacterized protein n=1 Tax=Rhizopus delemar TaxID=936053 RepID=A0A9P6XVE4_9FUNG|nr:hypothetical protein G6F50_015896 [Rhizopus delemar]